MIFTQCFFDDGHHLMSSFHLRMFRFGGEGGTRTRTPCGT
jgi:hypothetical protein